MTFVDFINSSFHWIILIPSLIGAIFISYFSPNIKKELRKNQKKIFLGFSIASSIALLFIIISWILLFIKDFSMMNNLFMPFAFTDLCAFSILISPLMYFIGYKYKETHTLKVNTMFKSIIPWIIAGSSSVFIVASPEFNKGDTKYFSQEFWNVQEAASFIYHVILLTFSLTTILIIDERYAINDYIGMYSFISLFILYIFITIGIPSIVTGYPGFGASSSGLLPSNFTNELSPYYTVFTSLNNSGIPKPFVVIIFYSGECLFAFFLTHIQKETGNSRIVKIKNLFKKKNKL